MYPYNLAPSYNNQDKPNNAQNDNIVVKESENIPLRPIEMTEAVEVQNNTTIDNNNEIPANRPPNPTSNQYLLDMIKEAIKDEANDADYYGNLLQEAPSTEDREILRQIRMDELKHYKLFNDIYRKITSEQLNDIQADSKNISNNLVEEFEKGIFDELEAVEFYRKLLFAFLDLEIRDILFEIITDEQAHSQKMNYLYCKYK